MVNMRTTLSIASLCLGVAVQAQDIIPVTQTVQFTAAAVATGSSFATLVPFNVDYTAQLDYRNSSVLDKYSTSVWQSRVDIYDDSESFNSFVSLQWPNGQGPSPAPVGISKDWRACVVAIPDLFDRLGVTNSGNGSCFDVINDYCLYNMMISASAIWESTIRQTTSLNDTVAAKACSNINSLPLAPGCFGKSSQETGEIRAYASLNPRNGQPFILGRSEYKSGGNKGDAQTKAISKAWPLLILEAQKKVAVNVALTCPSVGSAYFRDNFDRGNLDGWKLYGGSFDGSSKALVGKSSGGGKAIIESRAFADFTYEADMTFPAGTSGGNSGLVFRVSDPADGADSYRGYYAGLDAGSNSVLLGLINNNYKEIGRANVAIQTGKASHMKVLADGNTISVYVDDMNTPKITVKDKSYSKGAAGVRIWYADTTFDNINIQPLPPKDSVPSVDGTCGGPSRYKCTGTDVFYGKCCGASGFCGYSSNECFDGCQSDYGLCDTVVTVTKTTTLQTSTSTSKAPVATPTTTAVPTPTNGVFKDAFDTNLDRWSLYGGSYQVKAGGLYGTSSPGGKAVVKNLDVSNMRLTADVTIPSSSTGNAGVIFRVSSPSEGADSYKGYYAGISIDGSVILGRANQGWTGLKRATGVSIAADKAHHITVDAIGDAISVTVDNADKPQIEVRDGSFARGSAGVRLYMTNVVYDNFAVSPLVSDDFEQGNYNRWTTYGPSFKADSHALVVGSAPGAKAVLKDTIFDDFVYEADVVMPSGNGGNAGLIFRVDSAKDGADSYNGYYAGIDTNGWVTLGRANGRWAEIKSTKSSFQAGATYHFKVVARGQSISVFVNDMANPKISVSDATYKRGLVGVRVYQASATFDNIKVVYL